MCQQHVYAAQGGVDAGVVAVVEQGDVGGKTVYERYLAVGKRRAGGGQHILHARLPHADDVHVAFHQEALVVAHYGVLGLEEAVEFVALTVDFRFGGVDVFGLVPFQGSAAESHYLARRGEHGEDDASSETVVEPFPLLREAQEAEFAHDFGRISGLPRSFRHGVAAVYGITQVEGFDGGVGESAAVEIL